MNEKLVTAVITTYNRPIEILLRAVKSVLAQTYPNIELIVVNDAPENTALVAQIRETLESLEANIRYVVHDKNKKLSAARNTGLSYANGEYIAFLDDDDWWAPEKIAYQVAAMKDGVDVVYIDSFIVQSGKIKVYSQHKPLDDIKRAILIKNCMPGGGSGVMARTRCVREVGGFDTNLQSHEDQDMWIRLIQRYGSVYVNKPLVYYSMSDDSTFKNAIKRDVLVAYDRANCLFEKHRDLYDLHPGDALLYWNDFALSGLLAGQTKLYYLGKKRAFGIKTFHRYNFFLLPIKVKRRFFK